MSWQELELSVEATSLAEVEALLKLAGAEAVSLLDAANTEILEPEPGETPLWSIVTLLALFSSERQANAALQALPVSRLTGAQPRCREIGDSDWIDAWTQRPSTRNVGDRLTLLPTGDDDAPPGRISVRLNMGLAFGTGEHPTTRLCLEWLDANLTPGTTLVDFGCGSGVLAIAALRLGAERAWAVDIELQALTATRENAELNGVSDRLWTRQPKVMPNLKADLLIANILADTLGELVEQFASIVVPGGSLILAGILENQTESLRASFGRHFGSFSEQRLDGWALLSAVRS